MAHLLESFELLRGHPHRIVWAGVLALTSQVASIGEVMLAAFALGIDVPWGLYLLYVPLIQLAVFLPVSAGHGVGVREAAFVYLFGAQHLSPHVAFTLSLLLSTLTLLIHLPGAAFTSGLLRAKRQPGVARDPVS